MSANGNNKTVITCPHCKQRFSVTMPQASIFNDLRIATLVAPHEKPIRCICGKYSIPVLAGAEMTWQISPITDEQAATLTDSSIIIPPLMVN